MEEETGAELFYYFVESERNPGTDPVLVWLTGGPRCSAFSGLAYEIGPVKFVLEPYDGTLPRLVYSPDSWTRVRTCDSSVMRARNCDLVMTKLADRWISGGEHHLPGLARGFRLLVRARPPRLRRRGRLVV